MKKFFQKYKRDIVVATLSLVTFVVGSWIVSLYSKPELDKSTITQNPVANSTVQDSAQQTINQVPQINQNKGDVNNDFVAGDKIVNHTTIKQSKKKSDTVVVNNNGFINNGGTGNTYNQTVNPAIPQRHINEDDLNWLKTKLPKAKTFIIGFYNHDQESMNYVVEAIDVLEAKGYICRIKPFQHTEGVFPKEKIGLIEIYIPPDSTEFRLTVYPLPVKK